MNLIGLSIMFLSTQLHMLRLYRLSNHSGGFRNLERGGGGGGGGFSHRHVKRPCKFWGCHAHFRSRWKSELNISKQL